MNTIFDCGRSQPATRAEADIPIPLPPPAVHAPWPPRRGGASFDLLEQPRPFDVLPGAVAAMDASDSRPATAAERAEQARQEGFDAGMRCGSEYRSIWDVLVGALWGVLLLAVVLGLSAGAGWVHLKWLGLS